MENRIAIEQNRPERTVLLRAQRLFYGKAKRLQSGYTILALLLPAISAFVGPAHPEIRPFVALASVFLLLFEVGVISPKQREFTRNGAKVQELFDTEVLGLGWNRLASGSKVDLEDIRAITFKPSPHGEEQRLLDWYDPCVASLPIGKARIICQRTNITYDTRIRRVYADLMFYAFVTLGSVLFIVCLAKHMHIDEVLNLLVPFMPLATFLLREHRKHKDTIESMTTLKSEADKLWDSALKSPGLDDLKAESRGLQDAIYRNRSSNPLIYDWVYDILRRGGEDVASHTAKQMVAQAQQSMEAQKTA